MTDSAATPTVAPVTAAMAIAMVDEARAMRYDSGVIGLRGRPDRAITADVDHDGRVLRIRVAESALAAREVLAEGRSDGDWLVIVTDRDDDDLGAGILAHFIWQRLRSPDPWEAVRNRFSATGIDPALTAGPNNRALATALLAATPTAGWPAAPAGVLTRMHALGAVARTHLGFEGDTTDVIGVLRWSMAANNVDALGALRSGVGDLLADTTLDWIAGRAGSAAAPIRALLARGELTQVVSLGVVVNLLTAYGPGDGQSAHLAQIALARLETRWGESVPSMSALVALGDGADALLADLVHDRRADADVKRTLEQADAILRQIHAEPLARRSELLEAGLRARFVDLAGALRRAIETVADDALDSVEGALGAIDSHRLGAKTPVRAPFEAAVRLVRWLALPEPAASELDKVGELGRLARYHLDHAAWVDAAINDTFTGVDDPELAPALQAVVSVAQDRRRREERRFAAALAAAPVADGNGVPGDAGTVWYLERLMPGAVIPLAKRVPVLLLVLDGMSAATAIEIVADAVGVHGWLEAALPGADPKHRAAALSVLPSITEFSRASMLSGRLARGQQDAERHGYAELTRQVGKIDAKLFHKKGVDTTAAGWSVSHDVGAALDDTEIPLVTVVLNTIDDALDRSDPAGTVWTAAAVKHLEPLLARAATARRTVVITADHGHIVERRQGIQQSYPDTTSGRSRSAAGPVSDGEVEVHGPRVLTQGHRAVLAVDETLRYGPLKAGYHGGASAAEVVVPVIVLIADERANSAGLELIEPQVPEWWVEPPSEPVPATTPPHTGHGTTIRADDAGPTLFDLEPGLNTASDSSGAAPKAATGPGRSVVTSAVYRAQRKVAGRLIVTDEQVAHLIDRLVSARASRLPPPLAARALGIAETRLRGALAQVQQLLNVEGYAVLAVDPATGAVILDGPLLTEQFEVRL